MLKAKKKCTKCGETKSLSKFYNNKSKKYGVQSACKACTDVYQKAYREAHREEAKARTQAYREVNSEKVKASQKAYLEANFEKIKAQRKAYREANSEKIKAQQKAYRKANPDKLQAKNQAYYETNFDKLKAYQKAYREANSEKIKAQQKAYYEANAPNIKARLKAYHKRLYHSDSVYKFKKLYRRAILKGFKMISCGKNVQSLDCLGCSWADFVGHIVSQFYEHPETGEEMTLENHGFYGWHLDHIEPISNAKTKEDVVRLSHYTNFQPLWAEENLSKGNKS